MNLPVPTILIIVPVMMIAGSIIWRLASRRKSLPCPVWLRWLVELDNPFTRTTRATTIIENIGLQPGMTVLDVGCGPGRITLPAAVRVGPEGKVVALDIQEGMLHRVQEKAHKAGLMNIEFIHAGVGDGQTEPSHFDRAMLVTVLGEIPNRETAIQEIYAALKPGGQLAISEIIFDPHFQSQTTVRRLALDTGFTEYALYGHRLVYTLIFAKPAIK